MRTIKFRGKRIDNGEWVYGSLDLTEERPAILWLQTDPDGAKVPWFAFVKPETVGEFTGMLDKNGVEIYEGDIMKYSADTEDEHIHSILKNWDLRYKVCWYDSLFAFMAEDIKAEKPFLLSDLYSEATVIIGNIHDNPELLKGGQE